jgi:hypothetical protein
LKFVLSETLSREKLPKRLSYKKGARKTLMKLTAGKYWEKPVAVWITSNETVASNILF